MNNSFFSSKLNLALIFLFSSSLILALNFYKGSDNDQSSNIESKEAVNNSLANLEVTMMPVANCSGQSTIWSEDFQSYPDNFGIAGNNFNSGGYPGALTKWSLSAGNSTDNFFVETAGGGAKYLEGKELDNTGTWTSEQINILGYTNISFCLSVLGFSGNDDSDYVDVQWRLNGSGPYNEVPNWNMFGDNDHTFHNDFSSQVLTQSVATGNTLQLRVIMRNNSNDENYGIDNIFVCGDPPCIFANAGLDQDLCSGDLPYALAGTSVGGNATTGAWSILSQPLGGDGMLSTTTQVADPSTVNFDASIPGVYQLQLTTDDPSGTGMCFSPASDIMEITLDGGQVARCGSMVTLWSEDFQCYPDNFGFAGNNSNSGGYPTGVTKWTLSTGTSSDNFFVETTGANKFLEGKEIDNSGTWVSQLIPIVGYTDITFSLSVAGFTGNDNSDYVEVYWRINTGTWMEVPNWMGFGDDFHTLHNDFSALTVTQAVGTGNNLQLRVIMRNNSDDEIYTIDDIAVCGDIACNEPDQPTVTYTPSIICPGGTATLNISGNLNAADHWAVYTSGCGNNLIGQTTAPHNSFVIPVINSTTTYYVIGEGTCDGSSCGEIELTIAQPTVIAGPNVDACSSTLPFLLSGATIGGNANNAQWSILSQPLGGDGMLSNTGFVANPSSVGFTASIPGDYQLQLTTDDPDGSGTCNTAVSDTRIISLDGGAATKCGSQTTIWAEDFECYSDNFGVTGNGNSGGYPAGLSKWSLSNTGGLANGSDHFYVNNVSGDNQFEALDVNAPTTWQSESIDISDFTNVSFCLSAYDSGNFDSDDHFDIEYNVGSGWIRIPNWMGNGDASHTLVDDFGPNTITQSGLIGPSLQIRVIIDLDDGSSDEYRFDDVIVCGDYNPCDNPDTPTLSYSPNPACAGQMVTLNIGGNLNDADHWTIYSDACGMTSLGQTTAPHTSFNLGVINTSTDLYVRGEGACFGSCATINVDIQMPIADAGNDQDLCSGDIPYMLSGASVSGNASMGMWSITSEPFSGAGSLSDSGFTANPHLVTLTASIPGTYQLQLITDDPDGIGTCYTAAMDTRIITLDGGSVSKCSTSGELTIWNEDFECYADNTGVTGNGVQNSGDYPTNVSKWSIDASSANMTAGSDHFYVNNVSGNNVFETQDVEGDAIWISESIAIAGYESISFCLSVAENGDHEETNQNGFDYIDVEYNTGSGWTLIQDWNSEGSTNHTLEGDFPSQTITQALGNPASLQLRVTCMNTSGSEQYRFDNIAVCGIQAAACTPNVECPDPITVNCGSIPAAASNEAEFNALTGAMITACGNNVSISSIDGANLACSANTFSFIRTYTISIASQADVMCMQTVNVNGLTSISSFPDQVNPTVNCGGLPALNATSNFTVDNGFASSSPCYRSATMVLQNYTAPYPCGTTTTPITLTWMGTDNCGAMLTHSETVIVNPGPTITTLNDGQVDAMVDCGDLPEVGTSSNFTVDNGLASTDPCYRSATMVLQAYTAPYPCGTSTALSLVWMGTDNCGAMLTHTETVIVKPGTPITILNDGQVNATVDCGDLPEVGTSSNFTADNGLLSTDPCYRSATMVLQAYTAPYPCGTTTAFSLIWQGTDNCGATLTHTEPVIVNPGPTITNFGDIVPASVSCGSLPMPNSTFTANNGLPSNDPCRRTAVMTLSDWTATNPYPCGSGGDITLTWTGMDECNAPLTHSEMVTVVPAAPINVNAINDRVADMVNCGGLPIVGSSFVASNGASGTCTRSATLMLEDYTISNNPYPCGSGSGTISITWSGTDQCGTAVSYLETVTINPAQVPPTLTNPGLPPMLLCNEAMTFTTPTIVYDNGFPVGNPCRIEVTAVPSYDRSNGTPCNIIPGPSITVNYTVTETTPSGGCNAEYNAAFIIPVMDPATVPTIGEWGLLILGLLLSIFGVVFIKSVKPSRSYS